MMFKWKSQQSRFNQSDILPLLTDEFFVYWKRILYYNNLIKEQVLESTSSEQLLKILNQKSFSKTQFISNQIKLCLKLLVILLLSFSPRKPKDMKDISLVYGLADEQILRSGDTIELLSFLQSNRVRIPLNNLIYVERKKFLPHKRTHGAIRLVSDINLYLYLDYLTFIDRLKVLFLMFKKFVVYVRRLSSIPHFSLVAMQYVIDEVLLSYISTYSKVRINKLITTPSLIRNSVFVFQLQKMFKQRIMIWYSTNSIPIQYLDSTAIRATTNKQIFKYLPIDEHLVWNEYHKDYLKSVVMPGTSIKVCGSLLFYLPKIQIGKKKIYDVIVFDVTPYSKDHISPTDKIPYSLNSIYNTSHVKKFLEDILWVKNEILLHQNFEVNMALKPKRNYISLHDKAYTNYVNSLIKTRQIELIPSETNLYEIVSQSKLCISYPFTSTAVVAEELQVPSIYYLETNILKSYSKVNGINFIDDKTILLKFIKDNLIGRLK